MLMLPSSQRSGDDRYCTPHPARDGHYGVGFNITCGAIWRGHLGAPPERKSRHRPGIGPNEIADSWEPSIGISASEAERHPRNAPSLGGPPEHGWIVSQGRVETRRIEATSGVAVSLLQSICSWQGHRRSRM